MIVSHPSASQRAGGSLGFASWCLSWAWDLLFASVVAVRFVTVILAAPVMAVTVVAVIVVWRWSSSGDERPVHGSSLLAKPG